MRGDSLRDLYAKVLAVVGLALLAGAGALVDYWPAPADAPRVAALPRALPSLPKLPAVGSREILVPDITSTTASPTTASTTTRRDAAGVGPPSAELFLTLTSSADLPPGEPVALSPPQAAELVPVPAVDPPAAPIELAAPSAPPFEPIPAAAVVQLAPPQNGFFAGALKKTRDSIVKTGAATGASIADAFRGMFGAFKKVSPFLP